MEKRDAHVATQGWGGNNRPFAEQLADLGFMSDRLASNRIIVGQSALATSCPIIDIHVSRKHGLETIVEVRDLETQLHELFLQNPEEVGYWHTEYTLKDILVNPDSEVFDESVPVPFSVRDLQFRSDRYKTCDVHFDILRSKASDCFVQKMYEAGLYSISRMKATGNNGAEQEHVILTLQFVTPVVVAQKFFETFCDYYRCCGGPPMWAKFEVTTNERAYRGATTPPTTNFIEYR